VACTCASGLSGSQVCSSDESFGPCVCGGGGDSGSAATSGSDGAIAGTAGAANLAGAGGQTPIDGSTLLDGAILDATSCDAGATCSGACGDTSQDDSNCGRCGHVCPATQHCVAATCQPSKVQHVVLIVQENHTFDSYFGRYCQAQPGSNPTCTNGPTCCEGAPTRDPSGASPIVLDDSENFSTERDHDQVCELQQIDSGKMDRYVTGSTASVTCLGSVVADCSTPENWALAAAATVGPYWSLATANALADRYFQPIAGASSSNDVYFASAHFQFLDNTRVPNAIGAPTSCFVEGLCITGTPQLFHGVTTIGDLLLAAGKDFAVYADGYQEAKDAGIGVCASAPSSCPYSSCLLHPIACHACTYDAADNPFAFFDQFADRPLIKDYNDLTTDLAAGTLPNFSYVKARGYHNEHPNVSTITDGVTFVQDTIQSIEASSFADSTLILVTWDEGGGFFDHVAPPLGVDVDDQGQRVPYGTRVPLLAIGPFARKNTVSHVLLEHSSIVRFLEYNFIGPVGQLGHNDAKVHNIGSLLDPSTTGIHVPE
jgi:phospholipase C